MRVFGMGTPGNVAGALKGEKIGTIVTSEPDPQTKEQA